MTIMANLQHHGAGERLCRLHRITQQKPNGSLYLLAIAATNLLVSANYYYCKMKECISPRVVGEGQSTDHAGMQTDISCHLTALTSV